MSPNIYSLASLQEKQAALQKEIEKSRREMARHWQSLTARPDGHSRTQLWMSQLERSLIVYDGVMTGYKLLRRFNAVTSLFRRKKRK